MQRRQVRISFVSIVVLVALVAAPAGASPNCDGVSPVNTTTLTRVTVASGLTGRPLYVTAPPGDTSRIFVVEQDGYIRYVRRGDPPTSNTLFLDVSSRIASDLNERGLLSMAFDPDFQNNGIFYIDYTRAADGDSIVARYSTLDGTPNTLGDPGSETVLLRIVQPESNHNGGLLMFGADGYLYIGAGDGGGGGDVHGTCGNGQNTQVPLGKLLRIDPHQGPGNPPDCGLDAGPYTVPSSNPLADGSGGDCDEIWAYGLRNPWRYSFDSANGDLYIADVGQGCWEEIDYTPAGSTGGENYGWRQFEGSHCYNSTQGCSATSSADCSPTCRDPLPSGDPDPSGTQLSILDYSHASGCSITGGFVYRGCRMPGFDGTYFYGDYCAGSVLSLQVVGGTATNEQNWTSSLGGGLLTSFGVDAQGEMYIVVRSGTVYKIVPPLPAMEVSGAGAGQPLLLDATGDWTWEDLQYSSMQPISSYHVYRADVLDGVFNAGETFNCVHATTMTSWPGGGDPQNPAAGQMFAYVVVGQNGSGEQTDPGGTPSRTLSAASCP